jgi:Putative phage metallopeptidase
MATEYAKAEADVLGMLDLLIAEHFPGIQELPVPLRIEVLMASAADGGPALKRMGHRCAGQVSIVKAEERATGGPDVRIKIAGAIWDEAGDDTRRALLHHELNHIVPKFDKGTGDQQLDPYGRPVVKLRRDDWLLTGFRATVELFGGDAIERRALDAVEASLGQETFDFARAKPRRKRAAAGE